MGKMQKGFTLLELTIVLVIMAIIGYAVIPNTNIIYKQQIQKMANEIGMDLVTIRKQARATNKEYNFVIDSCKYKYSLVNDGDAVEAIRTENAGDSSQLTLAISCNNTTANVISFDGKVMKVDGVQTVEPCKIIIKYNDMETYGQLTFDNVTGAYSFEMMS